MPSLLLILGALVAVIEYADKHVSHADVCLGGPAPDPCICDIHRDSLTVP